MTNRPTEHEVRQALAHNATQVSHGRWHFQGSFDYSGHPISRPESEALDLTRACLTLGTPITDTMPARAFVQLVDRIAELEDQVARLRGPTSD